MSAQGGKPILVVGASGLVGNELMKRARARGLPALGAARTVRGEATEKLDLQDADAVKGFFETHDAQAVAICSAWPHVDGCETDPARSMRENVDTVRHVISAVKPAVPILFFSTDHVFDGKKPAYVEADEVNPLSVYAKHKVLTEQLLEARGNALIARTAWVFGADPMRKNYVYRVVRCAQTKEPLPCPTAQSGAPTHARWLAEHALSMLLDGERGLVHLTGSDLHTKASWARLIAEALDLPTPDIQEVPWEKSGQVAPRPVSVLLRSNRHSFVHPPLRQILVEERQSILSA